MGDVEIVLVPRERYSLTSAVLQRILATVAPDVRIILVRGGMSTRLVRRAIELGGDRLEVVGPVRHLSPNAARSIGLGHATARYVVFIDNDVMVSPGWLDTMVETAATRAAWVVRPLVLQRIGDEVTVHESGGDCRLESTDGIVTLVESHRDADAKLADYEPRTIEQVELLELHAALFDRERLTAIGGPDERLRSQGDHLDLSLRVRAAGGSVWLAPTSIVTFQPPRGVAIRDLPFFLGRWSPSWNAQSRTAFEEIHGVTNPADPYATWGYGDSHRMLAWEPIGRFASRIARRPVERGAVERVDRLIGRRLAALSLRMTPRWRGGGWIKPS